MARRGKRGRGKKMGGKGRTVISSPFTPAMHKGMGRGKRKRGGKSRY